MRFYCLRVCSDVIIRNPDGDQGLLQAGDMLQLLRSFSSAGSNDMPKTLEHARRARRYNHTDTRYYATNNSRGFAHVGNVARSIMLDCLPIQCVEVSL